MTDHYLNKAEEPPKTFVKRFLILYLMIAFVKLVVIPGFRALRFGENFSTWLPLKYAGSYFDIILEVAIYLIIVEIFFVLSTVFWSRILIIAGFVLAVNALSGSFDTMWLNARDAFRIPVDFALLVLGWFAGASFVEAMRRKNGLSQRNYLVSKQLMQQTLLKRLASVFSIFMLAYCFVYLLQHGFRYWHLYSILFVNYRIATPSLYNNFGWLFALPLVSITLASFTAPRVQFVILVFLLLAIPICLILCLNPWNQLSRILNYVFVLLPLFIGIFVAAVASYHRYRSII
jgi:hypothetical protein